MALYSECKEPSAKMFCIGCD